MNTVATEMIKYYAGDKKRINHFIKVHGYAKAIGEAEELDERTMLILETAAYVHDIGIKISEEKYNSSAGKYQEIEGPPIAEEMLTKLRYDKDVIERVSYLVAHHHTYSNIDGIDYQILVEADFLVNLFEDGSTPDMQKNVFIRNFRTEGGKRLFRLMFESGENEK